MCVYSRRHTGVYGCRGGVAASAGVSRWADPVRAVQPQCSAGVSALTAQTAAYRRPPWRNLLNGMGKYLPTLPNVGEIHGGAIRLYLPRLNFCHSLARQESGGR